MKAIIICERPDGWTWRIEAQEDTDTGVCIIYQEESNRPASRTYIGGFDDARALANAILAYVDFAEKHEKHI